MSGTVPEGLVDHAGIDRSFRELLEALEHPETDRVLASFQVLADRLRRHLGREELDIAKFADVAADDAKTLLLDHAAFRVALDALAAGVTAGTLTLRDVRDLKLRVALHEAREETGLYRWVKGR
jgi:hypothetical protein